MTTSLRKNLAEMDPRKRKLLEMMLAKEGEDLSEVGILPRPRKSPDEALPLSYAQERLFFLDRLEPDHSAYNVFTPLRLRGPLKARALIDALSEIVRRHEVLRTGFTSTDDGPVQRVASARPLSVPRVSLEALRPGDAEAEMVRLVKEEARRPFDLADPPMLRAALVRLADGEHGLLLDTHHIASDAWSLDILVREMERLYRSFRAGEASRHPEPPVQYADYALWQRRRVRGELVERQLGYWRETLAELERLDLPTDRPRPQHRSYRGARVRWELPGEVTGALLELARHERASPFMVFAALWGALLSLWANEVDVTLGTPVANRERGEIQSLVGFFLNTLVLRLDISADPDFRGLLRRTRSTALEAFEHQELPFEKLVEELAPERNPASTPLFESFLVVHHNPVRRVESEGLVLETLDLHNETAKFDCTLSVTLTAGRTSGFLEYDRDLFHATTIHRWARGFESLCTHAAAAPGRPLSAWPRMSGSERHQLLTEWNDTARRRTGRCLHHAIAEQSERTPDAVALAFEETCLTYGELRRRSRRLASRLRDLGAGPESPVGLCVHRSLELLVGALGILEAGAPYLPLDPEYPEGRLTVMLEEASRGVALPIVTQRDLAGLWPGAQPAKNLVLVDAAETYAAAEIDPATVPVLPDHPAYVIYTSGSTGRPKGVVNAHRGIWNRLAWMQDAFGLGPEDRVLQKTPISFDVSVWELFWPLLTGARMVLARPEGHRDDAYLARCIEREGVTTLHFVPSMLEPFLEHPDLSGLRSVRRVLSSGEALRRDLVERFHERLDTELHNLYGPTEAAVDVTWWPTRRGAHRIPIGRPIDNLRLHVLDRWGRAAPLGVAGELHLAGIGLARGYLSRPALTAERFIPDGLGKHIGRRHYRTGDLARYLPTGEIEYLGRLDHQVKVRGFRIELGEIETRLLDHPKVRQTVVVKSELGGLDRLVAYVVTDGDIESLTTEMRSHLTGSLPSYMVPTLFVPLEAIPKTPSGKVNRRALPVPEADRSQLDRPYVAPRNEVEQVLAELWARLLGVDRVGMNDGFFDMGGHSLLAIRLLSRVREVLDAELPLSDLFARPTVAAMAKAVVEARGSAPTLPPLTLKPPGEEPKVSAAQRRMWTLDQVAGGSPLYHLPMSLRLRGWLVFEALERSLRHVAQRHRVLRTRFPADVREPTPVVSPEPPDLACVDLGRLRGVDREAEAGRLMDEEARRPFDLALEAPWRTTLLRLEPDDHRLWVTLHHVAADGWSLGLLVEETVEGYRAGRSGRSADLPELPVQYEDYAAWQRRHLQASKLPEELEYWRRRLDGVPPTLDLPTDRPRPRVPGLQGGMVRRRWPAAKLEALRAQARRLDVTPFMWLLAVYGVLLRRLTGQTDLPVGAPVAGRHVPAVERLIGLFIDTVVVRLDFSGDAGFDELLHRVRHTALEAFANARLPHDELAAALRADRRAPDEALFQTALAYLNTSWPKIDLPDLRAEAEERSSGTAKFDLSLSVTEHDEGLHLVWIYRTELFDRATVQRFARHLEVLADAVLEDPQRGATALPVLTPAQRHQLRMEWNEPLEYPEPLPADAQVRRTAERVPDRVALVAGDRHFTYHEVIRRADRVARRLVSLGCGPETRVALALERSPELVTAILGIWRTGAAYVPLDPAYPDARLAYMLQDSRSRVLAYWDEPPLDASGVPAGTIHVRLDKEIGSHGADGVPGPASGGDDLARLAYIIYTSGSTGRPKGVMVPHRGLAHRLLSDRTAGHVRETERYLQKASASFDVSLIEFFLPLAVGACTVFAQRGRQGDPGYLVELIRRRQITQVIVPPSLLRAILEEESFAECASLRTVVSSAEALPVDLQEAFFARSDTVLYNRYGPTETSIAVSSWKCRRRRLQRVVPIGRPIARARLYVVDGDGVPVPSGVVGELVVGGVNLAWGYCGRPARTAAVFLPDPFGSEPGGRIYATGDRVRYRPDGALEFFGRADHQVKIRGFRVELSEIEAVLESHPRVDRAVVTDRQDTGGTSYLAVYWVGEVPGEEDASHLRGWLAERLPGYMVPSAFVRLDALPLDVNGKVDRAALPEPQRSRTEDPAHRTALRTPTEDILAEIWCEILGLDSVVSDDDFFELGGHSLLATRIASRADKAFGGGVSVRDVFEAPTLGKLAERIRRRQTSGISMPTPRRVERGREIPVSFTQERLWFLDRLDPGTPSYNLPLAVILDGIPAYHALTQSLDHVVLRHESLRTRLTEIRGRAVQEIDPWRPVRPLFADLTGLAPADRRPELRRLAVAESLRRFELSRGPLLRRLFVRLGPSRHGLLATIHHAVADGWSIRLLMDEMAVHDRAFEAGTASPLEPLPIQYADFAVRQRGWLTGDVLDHRLEYWRSHLRADGGILEIPTDRPRPAIQGDRGAQVSRRVSRDSAEAIRDFARRLGATPFMVLLAAFAAWLGRWSRQGDLQIAVPIANRHHVDVERLIGFFVNTLVLRVKLGDAGSFTELVEQTRRITLDAHAHQDLPFEILVSKMAPERDLSRAPLAQVMFDLNQAGAEGPELPGLRIEPLRTPSHTTKLDLSLTVLDEGRGRGLSAAWEYDRDLFDATTIRRTAGSFARWLDAAVAECTVSLEHLSPLHPSERHQLLREWTEPTVDAVDGTAHGLVERWIRERPDAAAVVYEDRVLTYGELGRRALDVAASLRVRGVGPETRVAVALDKSLELISAVLGTLCAGGAYVPLDVAAAPERSALVLADAAPAVLVTDTATAARLPAHGIPTLLVDEGSNDADASSRSSGSKPGVPVQAGNLAYVVFTSGSTGRPRGVGVTHGSLVHAYEGWDEAYDLFSPSGTHLQGVHLQMANVAFDVFAGDWVRALGSGGKLVLCSRDRLLQPDRLHDVLRRERVTIAEFVPAVARYLMDRLEQSGDDLSWMRNVVVGSDTWVGGEYERLRTFCGSDARVINSYGVSEATIDSSYLDRPGLGFSPEGGVPIGRPFRGTGLLVLDPDLRPVAIGSPGELFLRGAGLARGYWGSPRRTAERFLPDPSSETVGGRVYRTGDLARFLPDGQVDFLGRADYQVKIRGHRIELGEIESVLKTHPGIREGVVVLQETEGETHGPARLVAYLVPDGDGSTSASAVRRFLQGKLPAYMVPSAFVRLDALPLTDNGKVDRRALPDPEPETASKDRTPPRGPVEETLGRIWSDVLRRDAVGRRDNFFELGGDSILSIQIIARAADEGLRITPTDLFQNPTLEELAVVARPVEDRPAEDESPLLGDVPLTPVQAWFFEEGFADPHHWNQAVLLKVGRSVSPRVVFWAVERLVEHHDALRSRFSVNEDGTRVSRLADPGRGRGREPSAACTAVDLSTLSPGAARRCLEALAADLQTRLDFETGPLLRAGWFSMPGGEPGRLLLVLHHLVVDGVSWRIVLSDLERLSKLAKGNGVPSLPPRSTSYGRWATRLRGLAGSAALDAEKAFWNGMARLPGLRLPVDGRRRPGAVAAARDVSVSLDRETTERLLTEVPAASRARIQEVLVAALGCALAPWIGGRVVPLQLEGHGREALFDDVDLSRTVGWFTVEYPLVLDLRRDLDVQSAVRAAKEQLRRIPRAGVGYGILRYLEADPGFVRDAARALRPEVSFNYFGQTDQALARDSPFRPARESAGPQQSPRGHRTMLVAVTAAVTDGRLQGTWQYGPECHHRSTIERIAHRWIEHLRALAAAAGTEEEPEPSVFDFPDVDLGSEELENILQQMD